jgi:hypothetical protein
MSAKKKAVTDSVKSLRSIAESIDCWTERVEGLEKIVYHFISSGFYQAAHGDVVADLEFFKSPQVSKFLREFEKRAVSK